MKAITKRFLRVVACLALGGAAVSATESDAALRKDVERRMRQAGRLPESQFEAYLAEVYLPVRTSMGTLWWGEDAQRLDVPTGLGNPELAELGMVDVTAAPFEADPTGSRDATKAIQAAVDFARDHQMACFFPPGVYTISDTIECRQRLTVRSNGVLANAAQYPCVLIGSTRAGSRPRLRLAPEAAGFGDPENRKIVVHFLNMNSGKENDPELGPHYPQPNLSYSQFFGGIDIEIGPENGGAIGIRMRAAEGSSIQDVTIDATHGHTGMQSTAGSGGSHHGITVIGGRVGIDTRGWPPRNAPNEPGTQPGPTLSGITLFDQTEAAVYNYSNGALSAVGWHIRKSTPGPAIVSRSRDGDSYFLGQLCLVDSVVEFTASSADNQLLDANQGAVLRNVYVRGAASLDGAHRLDASRWSVVVSAELMTGETSYHGMFGDYKIRQPVLLDGQPQHELLPTVKDASAPPETWFTQHRWDRDFPSWEDLASANVKRDYGAAGDGVTDDTAALQRAINEHEIVFLPKGRYLVTDTLKLRPDTKLIGLWHTFSKLVAQPPFGGLAGGEGLRPVLATADTAEADTTIAFMGVDIVDEATVEQAEKLDGRMPVYALDWRCGGTSVVRSPMFQRPYAAAAQTQSTPAKLTRLEWAEGSLVRISGHGGGKWFNLFMHGSAHREADAFRLLLVEGTRAPLSFYQLHAQHSEGETQIEFRDAQNIDVFGVKSEAETSVLRAVNVRGLRIFGHAGWASALPGTGLYQFVDCDDFMLACFGGFIRDRPGREYAWRRHISTPFNAYWPVAETRNGTTEYLTPEQRPLLYQRGSP